MWMRWWRFAEAMVRTTCSTIWKSSLTDKPKVILGYSDLTSLQTYSVETLQAGLDFMGRCWWGDLMRAMASQKGTTGNRSWPRLEKRTAAGL